MSSIESNKAYYENYDWSRGGDEWSHYWGSTAAMWHTSLYPRLKPYLPTGTILEIGAGYGRVSNILRYFSRKELILTDIMPLCIEACQKRFEGNPRINCLKTNGTSLAGVPDQSVDLVISFYSLVDSDIDTIKSYCQEFNRVLTKNGVAFIHHSNSAGYFNPGDAATDRRMRLLSQYRDISMSAEAMKAIAEDEGLVCIRQECINWDIKEVLSDCFSTIVRSGSRYGLESTKSENHLFALEMASAKHKSRTAGTKRNS